MRGVLSSAALSFDDLEELLDALDVSTLFILVIVGFWVGDFLGWV